MPIKTSADTLFQGFSKLSREQRFQRLQALGALEPEDVHFLKNGGLQDPGLSEKLIENDLGYFQIPLGVASNFHIDGEDYVIPLAVEETSIIAALSKTAKWIRYQGEIHTAIEGEGIIGQIQFAVIQDFARFSECFEQHKLFLIQKANTEVAASMVQRGGGVRDLRLRHLPRPDGKDMAVIHLHMDSCDAMGANILNQTLEYLKEPLERLTQEKVSICILSNLNDQRLTQATVKLFQVPEALGLKIQEASLFAEIDPYRAATHNKGVMNGIDPVLIATGNDWRAVEAGVHAYAARAGRYQAITSWSYEASDEKEGTLIGQFKAPLVVGIVGGVTSLHPTAALCLRMMKVKSAAELSRILAAVGLVQNLGALKALCTEGIIPGHMKLHINNLLLHSDATESELPHLKQLLQNWLSQHKGISFQHVKRFLHQIRQVAHES